MVHHVQLGRQRREGGAVLGQHVGPGVAQPATAGTHVLGEMLPHPVRHQEGRILRPAVEALGRLDLLLAQRLAMRLPRALLLRRAIADHAVHDDHGGAVAHAFRLTQGADGGGGVVRVVQVQDVPAVALEPDAHVLAEGQVGRTLDGDVVAVVDPDQVGQASGARPGSPPRSTRPPSCRRRRTAHRCGSRTAGSRAGCSARRTSAAPSPCRRSSRRPGPAAPSWSPRRRCSCTPGGPA